MDEALGPLIYRLFTQGSNLLRRTFQRRGYDLTPEQWAVMAQLGEREGLNQSQLGEKTFKDRHNITRILNLLERRGYIERRPDDTDKRAYRIFLTREGREGQERLARIVSEHRRALFHGLNAEDVIVTKRVLQHIVGNIETKEFERTAGRRSGRDKGGGRNGVEA